MARHNECSGANGRSWAGSARMTLRAFSDGSTGAHGRAVAAASWPGLSPGSSVSRLSGAARGSPGLPGHFERHGEAEV